MSPEGGVLLEPIVKASTKRVLETTLGELEGIVGHARAYIKKRANRPTVELFALNLSRYSQIRTIWGARREHVDIREIYSPLRVQLSRGSHGVYVNSLAEIDVARNLLIVGTVGQGKSTFIRNLCVNQLINLRVRKEERIPILVELRNIGDGRSLQDVALDEFRQLGFVNIDKYLLAQYLKSGKFVLFFDGFDELNFSIARNVVMDLELLASRNPKLQMIVTTRPGGKIEQSRHFRSVYLDYLTVDQLPEFLLKLCRQSDKKHFSAKAESLLGYLKKAEFEIGNLLQTPLLLTLYWLSMKEGEPTPRNEAHFFAKLFHTLFFKHDSAKDTLHTVKFERERQSDLDYLDMQSAFEALSYRIVQNDPVATSVSYSELVSHIRMIERFVKKGSIEPHKFVEDIENATNLIQFVDDEIHYIHKSVLDYFSAAFVSQREDPDFLVSFFTKHLERSSSDTFPEGRFIRLISPLKYRKYFFSPLSKELNIRIGANIGLKDKRYFSEVILRELENKWTFDVRLHKDDSLRGAEILEISFQQPETATTFFDRDLWRAIERQLLPKIRSKLFADDIDDEWVKRFVVQPERCRSKDSFLAVTRKQRARAEALRSGVSSGRSRGSSAKNGPDKKVRIRAIEMVKHARCMGVLKDIVENEVFRLAKEADFLQFSASSEAEVTSWG